jgi:putative heme transporter
VQVLAWFAFARLLTAVPVTPAGLGLVEATLIGGLTGAGGDREQLTAAVLVYRALTWFLPILVGVVCLLWWRQSRLTSQPATPAGGPPVATPGTAGATSTDRPGTQARDRQPRP